jgi:hypothetical protein
MLSGWRKSYELTLEHMAAVRRYRDELATAWPPERSPAAAAYVARLDELLGYLQQTYDAAVANHTTFSTATLALSEARTDLKKVYDEYVANAGKLEAHEKSVLKRNNAGKGSTATPPPVADGRQAQLETQARSLMYGLSSELSLAQTRIAKPPAYDRKLYFDENADNVGGGSSAPPPIPPIVPVTPMARVGAGTASTGSNPNTATVQPPPTTPTNPRQPGLILGGAEPPLAPPPITPSPPPVVGPGPNPPIVGPGSLPPTTTSPVPPSRIGPAPLPPGGPMPIPPHSGRPGVPAQPSVGTGARPMPPGGIIGGTPGMFPGIGVSQPGVPGRPAASVNPVGGVINPGSGPSARGAPGHSTASATSQPFTPVGTRQTDRRDEDDDPLRWDPDNPWATAKGVAPVVMPPPEQRVDPGPAIGLN